MTGCCSSQVHLTCSFELTVYQTVPQHLRHKVLPSRWPGWLTPAMEGSRGARYCPTEWAAACVMKQRIETEGMNKTTMRSWDRGSSAWGRHMPAASCAHRSPARWSCTCCGHQLLRPSSLAHACACQQLVLAHGPKVVKQPDPQAAWALGAIRRRQLSGQAAAGEQGSRAQCAQWLLCDDWLRACCARCQSQQRGIGGLRRMPEAGATRGVQPRRRFEAPVRRRTCRSGLCTQQLACSLGWAAMSHTKGKGPGAAQTHPK